VALIAECNGTEHLHSELAKWYEETTGDAIEITAKDKNKTKDNEYIMKEKQISLQA